MKLSSFGRAALAALLSIAIGCGAISCGNGPTIGYLFATASKPTTGTAGTIFSFNIDGSSGVIYPTETSSVSSGGANPIAEVVSPNGKNLYVVNHDDDTIVQFSIASDGVLTAVSTANTAGTEPTAIAVDPSGQYLFVTDTFSGSFTPSNPGPGDLSIFTLGSDGSFVAGLPPSVSLPGMFAPAGVAVAAVYNSSSPLVYVYVTYSDITNTLGSVAAYSLNGGSLTLVGTYTAGALPVGVTATPACGVSASPCFLYIADSSRNQVIVFSVASDGTLTTLPSSPFPDGQLSPYAAIVDPRGKYLYISNYVGNNVSGYTINSATGTPSGIQGSPTSVGTHPKCLAIDPVKGQYLYSANYLDNSVGEFALSTSTGELTPVTNQPYAVKGSGISCVAIAPHGNLATPGSP